MLADDYFVLSQYTHLTDRLTELRQQYRALHYMQSHGRNESTKVFSTIQYLPPFLIF